MGPPWGVITVPTAFNWVEGGDNSKFEIAKKKKIVVAVINC